MSEALVYSGSCPGCGGLVYMLTTLVDNEIIIEYCCHSCGKVFSTI